MVANNKCIFCGNEIKDKTQEHVIPKWLIELTGRKNRKVKIHSYNRKVNYFNLESLKFKACEQCNNGYSILESLTKKIIEKMLNKEKIRSAEIALLMDWLDKVRIGMWLGSIQFNKNPLEIKPNFTISTRFRKDRILYVACTKEQSRQLKYSNFSEPLFFYLPCHLFLYINGLVLINVSSDYLLHQKIPLPNYQKIIINGKRIIAEFDSKVNTKIKIPYLGKRYNTFAQINYPVTTDIKQKYYGFFYGNLQNSKVIQINKKKMILYPETGTLNWIPKNIFYKRDDLIKDSEHKFNTIRKWLSKEYLMNSKNPQFKNIYNSLIKNKIL